jgi:CRP-like cAMP-binding protein
MQTVGDLKAHADAKLFAADHLGALHAYAAIVRLQPTNLDARLRVADTLLALGEVQSAAVVYTALARHASHAGYPLRALVALKILSALEPQLATLVGGLAELYAVGSPRLGRAVRMSPGDLAAALPAGLDLSSPPPREQLVEVAAQIAADTSQIAAYPEHLSPIPLFSELPADAFASVLGALKLVRTRPGEAVIRQGDVGQSFYVLARGAVAVTREDDAGNTHRLASLHDGSIFGEMALVSALPRSATVTAESDCDLLEFDREALAAAAKEVETIAKALDKFTRERLLSNLLATAPLFKPLDRKQRLDLVRRFTAHDVAAGTRIIEEGSPGLGLYVVLAGEVDVFKIDGQEKVLLATLKPGDVFGEISLLHDQPTTASVTAATNATVLFLAREVFQRLIQAVDAIREYVQNLGEERLMDTRILLSQGAAGDDEELTDDDLILI